MVVFSRKKNWQNTKNIPATKEEIVFWFQDRPGGGVLTLSVPCTKPTLMALLTAIHIEWGLQKTVASNNLGVHRGALKTLAGVHRLTTPFFKCPQNLRVDCKQATANKIDFDSSATTCRGH